jgi:hypothetical protein
MTKTITKPKISKGKRIFFGKIAPWIVVAVGVSTIYVGLENTFRAFASSDWPNVQGQIIRSFVTLETTWNGSGSSQTTRSRTYRPKIFYTYVVKNIEYNGERISWGEYATADKADATVVTDKYPKGAVVQVYYAPDNPQLAVLEPGTHGIPWFFIMLGSVFLAIGLLMVKFFPLLIAKTHQIVD